MDKHIHHNKMIIPFFFSLIIISPNIAGSTNNVLNQSSPKNIIISQIPTKESAIKEISGKNSEVRGYQAIQYYEKRYAVIIVGFFKDSDHYQWYTTDAQRQYDVLREKYNFSDNDIYVLVTLKEEWIENLSMDPAIIDYNATKNNIQMVFTHLASIISENDLLYIVVVNHGGDTHHLFFRHLGIDIDFWQGIFAHDTYFALEKTDSGSKKTKIPKQKFFTSFQSYETDEQIFDHVLKEYIQNIHARRIILVLQPCFSGGFINDLSGSNRIIITASTEVQLANAPFIGCFYYGLNGSANDTNHDGKISLGEIYEYSANQVYAYIQMHPDENGGRFQYPLLDDNNDKIGHRFKGFFGYDPNNINKDGYVASRIYNLSYEEI